jgi:hypothetical protein
MAILTEGLQNDINLFRDRVLTDPTGVLDPEGVVHHEFVSGNHGRMLDFDKISTDSDFYIDWVAIYARTVLATYEDELPDALVGIANGANRLSKSVAGLLGEQVLGLTTVKIDAKSVQLDDEALAAIEKRGLKFVVTIEDVGTTGSTTSTAIEHLREVGVERVESMNGWQRNAALPRLDALDVPYHAVILEPLPMFTAADCLSDKDGYCRWGIPLVPHA